MSGRIKEVWKKCIAVMLTSVFILGGSFCVYATESAAEDVENVENDILEEKNSINILLIGQDKREGEERQRSDTMILATLDKETKTLKLTSFMRDLYVQIPGYADNRMNAAYQLGGMELLDQVLETNFGIQVDGNIEVDFSAFQTMIDLLGGIEVELSQEEADYMMHYYPEWNLTAGVNLLTGEQALFHARNRSIGNSDYERTERQRDVVIAAFEKIREANLSTILPLADEAFSMIQTDLTHAEVLGYAMKVLAMDIETVESYRIPQDGAYTSSVIREMQVLVPDLEMCREYLQKILTGDAAGEENIQE